MIGSLSVAAQADRPLVAFVTDYADGNFRLLRYDIASEQITVVNAVPDTHYTFSNDQRKVAVWNSVNLWLSDLPNWQPRLLYTQPPDLDLVYVNWSPDDSRLLISTAQDVLPSLAYNLHTNAVENWNWDDCATFVQNVNTLALGILCSVEKAPDQARVFLWGGDSVPFAPDQFRLLTIPRKYYRSGNIPFWVNEGRTLGYAQAFNSEEAVSALYAGHVLFDVAFQTRRDPTEVVSGARSDYGFHFALSPDGTLGVFIQDSGSGEYHDVYLFSTDTGYPIRSDSLWFKSTTVDGLAWSPDNQRLFIHRFAYPTSYLSIVDVATGTMEDHAISQNYGGDVAVVYEDS